jgi:hypothetical protein
VVDWWPGSGIPAVARSERRPAGRRSREEDESSAVTAQGAQKIELISKHTHYISTSWFCRLQSNN